jgi:four helix bundle protein
MARPLQSFQELAVWRVAMELAEVVYGISIKFPRSELYGLTAQLRRASVSIPSNIAEGYGRNNRKEYLQFLGIANASRCELVTLLILAQRVGVATDVECALDLSGRVGQMLTKLMKSLQD